ncbi:GTPase Der [Buchnera aphidicola (Pterocallis alni)]|uniref:ribosome biogenesis GTPase Der n=1 Tax=Buchnera aphidicola TaxID=9 RepID=UPI00346425C6
MIFYVTIIGKTNVGKSTLFNKITKTHEALMHQDKNCTRDRKYYTLKIKKYIIKIVDTAGIEDYKHKKNTLQSEICMQTNIAINQSNIVLFVLDVQTGILDIDIKIINKIRKKKKEIFIIVNKIETINKNHFILNEFYTLGIKNITFISAKKNIGIKTIIKKINIWILKNKNLYKDITKKQENYKNYKKIVLSIVGKPNVGKSTLLNILVNEKRSIIFDTPGTTRDSIHHTIKIFNQKYKIIDTAGLKKKNKDSIFSLSILKTLEIISQSDIIIQVIDSKQEISRQDIWILDTIVNSGKPAIILLNKSEKLNQYQRKNIKKILINKYTKIKFFPIKFISTLYQQGTKKILNLCNNIYYNIQKVIKSNQLNKIMYHAINKNPPKSIHGKTIKLKYVHIGGYYPPKIVIHGNYLQYISKSYKKYLNNYFQNNLNIQGIIIKLIFKDQKI